MSKLTSGICLCAALTTACVFATSPDPARFDAEIRAFESWDRQNAVPPDAILFVGSSSIRMWQSAETFPNLPVINRGFGGSHISDVNHFADRIVLKYAPRTIVFYAGDNDIAAGKSPQQVVSDFQKFAKLVHDRLPDTRIIYLPIKPSPSRWHLWPQMQAANALVQELIHSDEMLLYIDTATPMLGPDGQPRKALFLDDDLHMNAEGYRVWTEILAPHLKTPSSALSPR
ncbi:MAG: SGNH/GDSL hydrolase family protein [Pirellulales bacterium]